MRNTSLGKSKLHQKKEMSINKKREFVFQCMLEFKENLKDICFRTEEKSFDIPKNSSLLGVPGGDLY